MGLVTRNLDHRFRQRSPHSRYHSAFKMTLKMLRGEAGDSNGHMIWIVLRSLRNLTGDCTWKVRLRQQIL